MLKFINLPEHLVLATLAGAKTQFRKVITPKDMIYAKGSNPESFKNIYEFHENKLGELGGYLKDFNVRVGQLKTFGDVGETFIVKEPWEVDHSEHDIIYLADNTSRRFLDSEYDDWFHSNWLANRSKRHGANTMPQWASRIELEITSIKAERLQDISRADAAAEGICFLAGIDFEDKHQGQYIVQSHQWPEDNYERLWDSMNKKEHSFRTNPFVQVVEFTLAHVSHTHKQEEFSISP